MTRKRCLYGLLLWLPGLTAYGAEAMVTGHHLRPASATMMPGRTVKLKLVHCFVEDKPKANPERAALVCEGEEGYGDDLAPLVVPVNVKWAVVSGPGHVNGNGLNATYHAPDAKPSPNEATVTATFTQNVGSQKTIVYARIKIVDEVEEYRGKATFQSPVAGITGSAKVTWTRIRKKKEDDDDDDKISYRATGTIDGKVSVPDCAPKHVTLPINPSDNGELIIEPAAKTYNFTFSSESPITLMCGKPGRPWLVAGASFFHFGSVCGHPEGVPLTDLLALGGTDNCTTTGLFGTTTWSFEAVK